jgi:Domain of unknown function (DUF309)
MVIGVIYFFVAIGSMLRPRWLPQNSLPPYAYLPGKKPHPVRDPKGHSYHVEPIPVAAEASVGSDAFLWGLDLFNHGYYWEAHEAWEGLWQVADRDGMLRTLFKGLILLSAPQGFGADLTARSKRSTVRLVGNGDLSAGRGMWRSVSN